MVMVITKYRIKPCDFSQSDDDYDESDDDDDDDGGGGGVIRSSVHIEFHTKSILIIAIPVHKTLSGFKSVSILSAVHCFFSTGVLLQNQGKNVHQSARTHAKLHTQTTNEENTVQINT